MTATISARQLEIIEAAGKILTASGVSGLTIKNLAKEMEFSDSALYRHFLSKEKIIIALLDYLAANIDERYSNAISNQLSTEEKFKMLFQNQFMFFSKNPHFVVAVFSDGLLEESDLINKAIQKIMVVKMKYLKPIIVEGRKNKVFSKSIPEEDLIHIVMGAVRLQMYKWRVANFQFDNIKQGNKMIQSLLTLIK
ncbi:TetR/AcrR family transcriptional regulator [Aurantibacillus circumpalustris]|uniref:TetR/AcrR family transcriptional regulator n=1 Tax=Aurantibacillus circumpalustris TaxID=3036359 RepID=UPI00295BFF09|nr:TetR/AcrR family transcriptional regulator [Aurantibacillus circumpalustris]